MVPGKPTIALTPFHRISMLFLIIIQSALFLFGFYLFINYVDPLPFVPYPSMTTATSTETHYLKNGALYLLFWIQHAGMATLKYKMGWQKKWKYFVLYDRYIFNVTSGLTLWYIFAHLEPSNIHLFTIPMWICLPLKIVGVCLLATALWQLGDKILMPWSIRQILTEKCLSYQPYGVENTEVLKSDGAYGYIRNPIQTANLLVLCFGGGVYTTERLMCAIIMGAGVIIGTMMEEKRMLKQYKGYREYMEKVKARYIPFI